MSAIAQAAWLDAWEGPSTPSPFGYRDSGRRRAVDYRERDREPTRLPEPRPSGGRADDTDWTDTMDLTGSVVRLSAARERRRCQNMSIPEVPAIDDYDWEAASRRRPNADEYERVILHTGRTVEAHMTATHYYTRGATAQVPVASARG